MNSPISTFNTIQITTHTVDYQIEKVTDLLHARLIKDEDMLVEKVKSVLTKESYPYLTIVADQDRTLLGSVEEYKQGKWTLDSYRAAMVIALPDLFQDSIGHAGLSMYVMKKHTGNRRVEDSMASRTFNAKITGTDKFNVVDGKVQFAKEGDQYPVEWMYLIETHTGTKATEIVYSYRGAILRSNDGKTITDSVTLSPFEVRMII